MANFRLIEDSFEEISNEDFFDKLALVGHNCYQVNEKTHQDNIAFIKRLIDSKHLAMIEHFRFTFVVNKKLYYKIKDLNNKFIELTEDDKDKKLYIVSTSIRVLLEFFYNGNESEKEVATSLVLSLPEQIKELFKDYVDLSLKGEKILLVDIDTIRNAIDSKSYDKHKFVTYHIITDRGVTHELVRHRLCSFAQESTRYCNYTKDKFDNSLTFLKPLMYEENKDAYDSFYTKCTETYFKLIENGCKPDQARSVLPNSLKASIMVSANLEEWKNIFNLRTDSHAHEDIQRIMKKVKNDMIEKGYIKND